MNQGKFYLLIVFSILVLFVINACDEDNPTEPEADAPILPPETTFVMDFDDFTETSLAKPIHESLAKPQSKKNWLFSVAKVAVWQTVIGVTLAVPAYSYSAAISKDRTPEFKNGVWIWTYDFNALSGLYRAELHGKIVADEVEWEMYISKEGEFDNFKWYTGKSKLIPTEGTWTLNLEPQNPVPVLGIEWHRNPDDLTYDIKYTNILEDSDDKGSYIQNGVTTDTDYDAFYTIYSIKDLNFTEIKWSRTSKDGRVKDPKYFGDADWHCWDENQDDKSCDN